jgi:hypothetical protein
VLRRRAEAAPINHLDQGDWNGASPLEGLRLSCHRRSVTTVTCILTPFHNLGGPTAEVPRAVPSNLPCVTTVSVSAWKRSISIARPIVPSSKMFLDTFQLIALRAQKPRPALDREAQILKRLMSETGAPCWQPNPPSVGACQVQ